MDIPGTAALRAIVAGSVISTALHYTHNYLKIEQYPQPSSISNATTQLAIVILWPLLTAIGLTGYILYTRGRLWGARACLLVYSLTGLVTLAHFMVGVPDVPWYWFITIFTDALAGLALWAFVFWSAINERTRATAA
ncbi:hypothetical protein LWC34_07055 [Kibdelosporangium philippinense]|uniref:Uncharacterized protein n=1 Tax=Kibdelosporangium philippinense TaxID=211113 RepID=A0ABS8Z6C0_9PSEU|nr:hypothetical protein [Kibdelosporangium philippinense]MCE7002589.1 hypothetical protein [Kibdelosporangium philippinense]